MACCRNLFKSNFSNLARRFIMTSSWNFADAQGGLENNPYFDKYAAKIREMRSKDPEEYEQKLRNLTDKKSDNIQPIQPPNLQKPDVTYKEISQAVKENHPDSSTNKKSLEQIMNIDLLFGKTPQEIEKIWTEYYKSKDVIYATLNKASYKKFVDKCQSTPTFVVPLPRGDGCELFLSQWNSDCIHFASLAHYHLHKEFCSESLCITYFPELPQDIVLMLGEYNKDLLSGGEARCLVNTLQLFYNSEEKYKIVEHFNKNPTTFDHNILIQEINKISLD